MTPPSTEPNPVLRSAQADSVPEVVETALLLPIHLFHALDAAARREQMTVGQLIRTFIGKGLGSTGETPSPLLPPEDTL